MNSSKNQEKIVIVGFGWVGQANALALKRMGHDVAYFDPGEPPRHYPEFASIYDSLERLTSVLGADSDSTWYFVCVGDRVSDEGEQDISNIKAALDSLRGGKGGIVLRSTIIPDLLENLSFDYYLPEFLHEKKAVDECIDPYLFVVGKKNGARPEPAIFSLWRVRSHKVFDGTPREASFIKYLWNLWNATRVAFVNEFGDAIGRPVDKEHLSEIEKIVDFLFDNRSYLRYGKSFGGHCLPKDIRAFTKWYSKNTPLTLLKGVQESNAAHRALEEKFPLMPEWYSQYPDRFISGKRALRDLWKATRKYLRQPGLVFTRFMPHHFDR